jgi:5'-nucleotidase
VSGIRFKFDPSKAPGSRIQKDDIEVDGEPIDYERDYKVSVKHFLALGKDGFDFFKDCEVLVDEENGINLCNTGNLKKLIFQSSTSSNS